MSIAQKFTFLRGASAIALLAVAGCGPLHGPQVTVTIKSAEGTAASADAAPSAAAEAAPVEGGYGNLVGTVTYESDPPKMADIVRGGDASVKDASVCSAHTIPDESLVVDPATKGIANVVIYLDKKPANIKPELAAPPTEPVIFDQKGCRFLPHVLTVRIGQPLLVISDDSIAHNTHTFPLRNTSFNGVIPPLDRKGIPCTYTKAENTPIEVKCDLHSWMKAYHFPIDHPYVAVTDAQGKFSIKGLPAGKHTFKVWQEKASGGLLERKLEVTIKPDADTTQDLKYGAAKFAAIEHPSAHKLSYAQLQRGGHLTLAQTESSR